MITLQKYLTLNPTETEQERNLAEFAGKIESRLLDAEKLLRQVLPDYADEAENLNGCKIFGEITEKDVVMIRDFLSNVNVNSGLKALEVPRLFEPSEDFILK